MRTLVLFSLFVFLPQSSFGNKVLVPTNMKWTVFLRSDKPVKEEVIIIGNEKVSISETVEGRKFNCEVFPSHLTKSEGTMIVSRVFHCDVAGKKVGQILNCRWSIKERKWLWQKPRGEDNEALHFYQAGSKEGEIPKRVAMIMVSCEGN